MRWVQASGGSIQGAAEEARRYVAQRRKARRRGTLARSDYVGIFPLLQTEDIWESMRILCSRSNGIGYNFTRADFMQMTVPEIESHIDWLHDRRQEEEAASRQS